jgi:diguanylate cyclase (GGDEF)-like protein
MVERRARRATAAPGARVSLGYVLIGGLVAVTSQLPFVPQGIQDAVYSLVSASVVVAIIAGVRRHRPRSAAGWYFMAAGQFLWVIADAIWNWQEAVLQVEKFPSIADAFYLAGYPVMTVGLVVLVRSRSGNRHEVGPTLDSLTVTAGLSLLSWVLLVRPTIQDLHQSTAAAAVGATYPAMDILLIGVLVRLISSPGARSTAFRHLLAALTLLLVADTLFVVSSLYTTQSYDLVNYLWLLSYVAWGGAALHPTMTTFSDAVSRPDFRFRGIRLMSVVLACLIAPTVLAIQDLKGAPIDVWAVVIGSVLMFLLVVVRMSLAIDQIAGAHEALEKLQDELAVQATHDPLTGLANRTQSMRLLAGALGRARRRRSTVGLLFIDLDGFKGVNDNNGHRSGDEVLRHVARRMTHEIREVDFVARLGGDEFVVGVEDVVDEASVVTLAHRLIAAISQPIRVSDDLTVQVGASVGIALGRGGETDVETLLHEADLAVYRAKAAGRGCAELFSWTARAALKERNELERALVGAIADNELVLHFQPIVDTETGLVDCFEALVRWDRPGHGLLPPDDFLPVAESSDLICQLDTWVLREAVAQLSRWNRMRGDRDLKVAVNISGRHISQHRIQSDVAGALRVSTVDPGQLVIEVTETALMDGSVAATNLEALRTTGVIVSLDDFGTGYQSSAQLSRLPVDVLKIDRRFVDTSSAAARSLLELMVKAAHAFGAQVVAEGVENEEELEFAREIGCEYVQGFHIARPAPADQLAALDGAPELAG